MKMSAALICGSFPPAHAVSSPAPASDRGAASAPGRTRGAARITATTQSAGFVPASAGPPLGSAGPPLVRARVLGAVAMLGPAFVASVAYVDPGNFATNIQSGARYGYLLLWVVLAANLMAMLVQYLSAKLGIVTDQSLPEQVRGRFPRPVTWGMWLQAEVMAMATDIAEFVGAALGLN